MTDDLINMTDHLTNVTDDLTSMTDHIVGNPRLISSTTYHPWEYPPKYGRKIISMRKSFDWFQEKIAMAIN